VEVDNVAEYGQRAGADYPFALAITRTRRASARPAGSIISRPPAECGRALAPPVRIWRAADGLLLEAIAAAAVAVPVRLYGDDIEAARLDVILGHDAIANCARPAKIGHSSGVDRGGASRTATVP
jgi:hypothetical protein